MADVKKLHELSSNEYYGGLANRFEKRAAKLREHGFKYERIEEYGIAVFTRPRWRTGGKTVTIPAATLHHADNRAWNDTLRSVLTM